MCNGSHLGYDFCQNRLNLHDVKIKKKIILAPAWSFLKVLLSPWHIQTDNDKYYVIQNKFPVDNIYMYLQSVSCIQDVIYIIYPIYMTFNIK